MKILVINCGSSSLKYQILEMTTETLLCKGLVEKIGITGSTITHEKIGENKLVLEYAMKDHKDAIEQVLQVIRDKEYGVVKSMDEIGAVGHRIGHGGERYNRSVIVTDDVIKAITDCIPLAPLHNPANLLGISACQSLMPGTPNVAVFDTAFHQTMPPESYIYAIPYEYYKKYGIRRYGFHGTSHKYVSMKAAEYLRKPASELKIVTCHLGNGSSISAVKNGKSVDTTMGFTPLAGIMMGTRSGDLDPAIIEFLEKKEGVETSEILNILNKKSGAYGVSGVSSDFRDLTEGKANGNKRCALALDIFEYDVKKYIGAYAAAMGGIDAVVALGGCDGIVFTAGIGENDAKMRSEIVSGLEFMGIKIDSEKNEKRGTVDISAPDATVKTLVIPTDEELMIALDTQKLV